MEDLEGKINKPTDAMTEEELQFHYFKVHDYNDDNKLDGIELITALTHHNGLLLLSVFIDDRLSRFDTIPACDRQTDGWTDVQLIAIIYYLYSHRAPYSTCCYSSNTSLCSITMVSGVAQW